MGITITQFQYYHTNTCEKDDDDDDDDDAQSSLLCCCVVLRSVVRAMRLAPWCRWRRQRDVVCTARARRRRERNGQLRVHELVHALGAALGDDVRTSRGHGHRAPHARIRVPRKRTVENARKNTSWRRHVFDWERRKRDKKRRTERGRVREQRTRGSFIRVGKKRGAFAHAAER